MLDFLNAAIHWRPIVCVLGTAAMAFVLAQWVPWFDGLPGIVLGCLGVIPGVIWQAKVSGR